MTKKKELLQCAVDMVWADASCIALTYYDGRNLEDEICVSIENICFEHVCCHVDCSVSSFAKILGGLSSHRMIAIASRLTAKIRAFPHNFEKSGVRAASAFGYLRLSLATPLLRRASTQCLRLSLELTQRNSCKCLGLELKHAICDALVCSLAHLQPAASTTTEKSSTHRDMDADAWSAVLELARTRASGWAARPKHRASAIPLLAALAVAEEEDANADSRVCAFIREVIIDGGALAPPKAAAAVAVATGLTRALDLRLAGALSLLIIADSIRRRNVTGTAESRRALLAVVRSRFPALASKADLPEAAASAIADTLAIGAEHFDAAHQASAGSDRCEAHTHGTADARPWLECILQLLRAVDDRQASTVDKNLSRITEWKETMQF